MASAATIRLLNIAYDMSELMFLPVQVMCVCTYECYHSSSLTVSCKLCLHCVLRFK